MRQRLPCTFGEDPSEPLVNWIINKRVTILGLNETDPQLAKILTELVIYSLVLGFQFNREAEIQWFDNVY